MKSLITSSALVLVVSVALAGCSLLNRSTSTNNPAMKSESMTVSPVPTASTTPDQATDDAIKAMDESASKAPSSDFGQEGLEDRELGL
jgi:hypothetical protein